MRKIFVSILAAVLLAGCGANLDNSHYNTSAAGQINNVQEGTIISARAVSISTENGTVGQLAGGIAGGVAGNTIGGSSVANTLGAIGGAVLGGYLGGKAQQGLSTQGGMEYIVKLDSGRTITLTQGTDVVFSVGQSVYVLDADRGERARIIAK